MAPEQTAVDPVCKSFPGILSYPTMVMLSGRKTPRFATLLSSHKAQYFSFTDSTLLILLRLCGKNSQKPSYIYSLGDRYFLQITY